MNVFSGKKDGVLLEKMNEKYINTNFVGCLTSSFPGLLTFTHGLGGI